MGAPALSHGGLLFQALGLLEEGVNQAEGDDNEDNEEPDDHVGDVPLLLQVITHNIFIDEVLRFFVRGHDLGTILRSVRLADLAGVLIEFPFLNWLSIDIDIVTLNSDLVV